MLSTTKGNNLQLSFVSYSTALFEQLEKVECLYEYEEDFQRTECRCPIPCSDLIFTPSISYSALSDIKLQQLLLDDSVKELERKFSHALEVKERVTERNR